MLKQAEQITYALGIWPDTRLDSITREAAAGTLRAWRGERLPLSAPAEHWMGWEAALNAAADAVLARELATLTREEAAQAAEALASPYGDAEEDAREGWESAIELAGQALRFEAFHL